MLTTAGNLVFQGHAGGRLTAYEARSGRELWSFDLGVGTIAPPITYELDGRQYISILAGWTGGTVLLGSLSAQHGWIGRGHPRRLLTFALDGKARLPAAPPPARPTPVDDPDFIIDAAKARRGAALYGKCVICHGVGAVAGGYIPDLRASAVPLSPAAFEHIVRGGALLERGMPAFDELGDDDLEALRHFLRERARHGQMNE